MLLVCLHIFMGAGLTNYHRPPARFPSVASSVLRSHPLAYTTTTTTVATNINTSSSSVRSVLLLPIPCFSDVATAALKSMQLRGGYYPRIFFPGLYNAKERFFKNFETVYYLKALPGGWLFRRAPEDWQVEMSLNGCFAFLVSSSRSCCHRLDVLVLSPPFVVHLRRGRLLLLGTSLKPIQSGKA